MDISKYRCVAVVGLKYPSWALGHRDKWDTGTNGPPDVRGDGTGTNRPSCNWALGQMCSETIGLHGGIWASG